MVARASFEELSTQIMPTLYDLRNLQQTDCEYSEEGYFNYPPLMNLSFEAISDEEVICLLDDGFKLYLFLGSKTPTKVVASIFGKKTLSEVFNPFDFDQNPGEGNQTLRNKIMNLVTDLRAKRSSGWADLVILSPGHIKSPELEDE